VTEQIREGTATPYRVPNGWWPKLSEELVRTVTAGIGPVGGQELVSPSDNPRQVISAMSNLKHEFQNGAQLKNLGSDDPPYFAEC